jgi:hypothetical protein
MQNYSLARGIGVGFDGPNVRKILRVTNTRRTNSATEIATFRYQGVCGDTKRLNKHIDLVGLCMSVSFDRTSE